MASIRIAGVAVAAVALLAGGCSSGDGDAAPEVSTTTAATTTSVAAAGCSGDEGDALTACWNEHLALALAAPDEAGFFRELDLVYTGSPHLDSVFGAMSPPDERPATVTLIGDPDTGLTWSLEVGGEVVSIATAESIGTLPDGSEVLAGVTLAAA